MVTLNPFGMPKRRIIALTGGIASGKSTVLREFKRLGAQVLDCDAISRKVSRKGGPAIKEISDSFGTSVINKAGALNRKKLGSIIFADKRKRKVLETILHPMIIVEIGKKIPKANAGRPLILDVPLLFEAGLNRFAGKVIVVWAPENTRITRLKKRDKMNIVEIKNRISSQIPLEKKKSKADYIVDNSGSIAAAKKDIINIWEVLTKEST